MNLSALRNVLPLRVKTISYGQQLKLFFLACLSTFLLLACSNTSEKSRQLAVTHVHSLVEVVQADVTQVRSGLPKGAALLTPVFEKAGSQALDYQTADRALTNARGRVEELRRAKSNFFLIAQKNGAITRNNLEQDDMAGESLFKAYPTLQKVASGLSTEVQGSWPIARGVNGRTDAQWVSAVPIKSKDETIGIYATGWSWSTYAERLESRLRDEVLKATQPGENVPLIYIYVIVNDGAYGAPVAPMVNIEKVLELKPLKTLQAGKFSQALEILGTSFGVALEKVPAFGDAVTLVVLRSET